MHGILNLPWWGYIVITLALTQVTILSVTVYLHRCMAHRALDLHPIASHFFRFWLWMTTGMTTKAWTSIHRKHHAKVETDEDPHSPQTKGIMQVLLQGAELYRKEKANADTQERYGEGTPDDWLERNVYSAHSTWGIYAMLVIDLLLFGTIGLTIWAVQMAWIPFFAAGVINGIGHYVGYRNFECPDASRNIAPLAFFIGGEELHNNHHTYGTSAKFSVKWWEFDIGWLVIRTLQCLGLAKPKRVPPKPVLTHDKAAMDIDTVKAILTHRFQVLAQYSKKVISPVLREEHRHTKNTTDRSLLRRTKKMLMREPSLVDATSQEQLKTVFERHQTLNVVYQFRLKLQKLWIKSTASQAELLEALQEWCRQAEATGIKALREFVKHLKAYVPQKTSFG